MYGFITTFGIAFTSLKFTLLNSCQSFFFFLSFFLFFFKNLQTRFTECFKQASPVIVSIVRCGRGKMKDTKYASKWLKPTKMVWIAKISVDFFLFNPLDLHPSHRYRKEIPELPYHPCNGNVSHGAPVEGIWILLTTHAETNANKLSPRSLCTVWHFTCVYLQAPQTANDMHLMNQGYFDRGKNLNPNWSPMPG